MGWKFGRVNCNLLSFFLVSPLHFLTNDYLIIKELNELLPVRAMVD